MEMETALQAMDVATLEAGWQSNGLHWSRVVKSTLRKPRPSLAIKAATSVRDRLASQERELVHSLERMRLARLQLTSEDGLTEQLTDMHRRLDADVEIEKTLAAARRAARQRT